MKLLFSVTNQELKRIDKHKVVADSRNYLKAKFNFTTDEWSGVKTALFKKGNIVKKQILDEHDECEVPWEVIRSSCFSVSVYTGELIPTNEVIVGVERSGYGKGEASQPPTPDIYLQIMALLNALLAGGSWGSSTETTVAEWESGLWTVQPWVNGDVYAKDGYSYCADFQLEPNTTYTIQISTDDGQTMYVNGLDASVSQHGFYQTFTTDDTGIVPIWLISGRKEADYINGTIKACLVKGSVPIWQGENIMKLVGDWAVRSSVKDTYPYNRFLDMYSPFGKYFSFNTGSYNKDHNAGETWSGLTIGCPTYAGATEAGMRLEVPNGGVDFSFLNGMHGGTDVCLDFNMGIWGNATGAKYIFAFNESDIGTQYNRFIIEKGAIPLYLTKDGIMVKEDNTATVDATEGKWKTVNLYNLESRVSTLEDGSGSDSEISNKAILDMQERVKLLEEAAFASGLGLAEVLDGEVFAVEKELTSRTLMHSWDFASSMIDTVSGTEAILNNAATQTENGIFIGYGNATNGYMKGNVFFENVFGRGKEIEVDVYSMIPSFDTSSHGRFLMFDSTSSNFDEGLIYRNTGAWSFYLNGGWSNEFSDLAKDCFNGKTVKIRVDTDGTTKLYADGALLGVCSLVMPETSVNITIGSDARTYTGITISGMRIYDLT